MPERANTTDLRSRFAEVKRQPPDGCTAELKDEGIVVRAQLFSLGGYLRSLGMNLLWNGVVGSFALGAFESLYSAWPHGLIFALPILPHLFIGLCLLWGLLLRSGGSIEIVIEAGAAYVSTGLGPIRWRQHFDPRNVREIKIDYFVFGKRPQPLIKPLLEIDADRRFKFGILLTDERREWVQKFLHDLLVREEGKKKGRGRKRRKSSAV